MTDRRNTAQVENLLAHGAQMTRICAFEQATDQARQVDRVKDAAQLSVGQEAVRSVARAVMAPR